MRKGKLAALMVLVFLSIFFCILFGVRLYQKSEELEQPRQERVVVDEEAMSASVYSAASVEQSSRSKHVSNAGAATEEGKDYNRKVYLTFDDGPSSNTDRILDILESYDVKATFFVVGKEDEASVASYQRIVEEGHTLAMHSYTHIYHDIYASRENFEKDLSRLQEHLYQVTGIWPRYVRFPGGSSNQVSKVDMQELISYLHDEGMVYFDWNIASGDAAPGRVGAQQIVRNCMNQLGSDHTYIILLHDAGAKNTTVEALPILIEEILSQDDTVILPITDDTEPIQHVTLK